ncbi:MAG: 8-oxo-dGTP diphosphatase MutT [Pseudomonadales bacterium]|nr:8-oxo-dGTP diphosphatase MutT [Pseudomonadales bacterium]
MNPAPLPSPPLLRVAVGVVINARDEVLITRRHAHLHQGGLWEFPGGKIHAHESSHDALRRELAEELAIRVEAAEPLLTIDHDYPDRSVRLEVWRVSAFSGTPSALEGQPMKWQSVTALDELCFPAANVPIIEALRCPLR